jgi:hypothetical protein
MRAESRELRTPPNGRDPSTPKPRAQRNFTDPESKIMKTNDGAFHLLKRRRPSMTGRK